MTDTTTTEGVVLTKDHRIKAFNWLYRLAGDEGHKRVSILEEYVSGLEEGIEALQATTTQQAWDMRSLEITVENLRAEVERLREVLEDARHSLIHADELTLEMLREWLAGQAYISHTRSLQVYDGNLNVHWERYAALEEIIAIIDEGRIPGND